MFDWTIHVSDVVLLGGLLWAVVRGIVSQREINQKIVAILGSKEPPDGLLGDVEVLKRDSRQHREWLILIRGKANGS